jgi:peptidoglycan/LPS O-acetylase OafA/YrhL
MTKGSAGADGSGDGELSGSLPGDPRPADPPPGDPPPGDPPPGDPPPAESPSATSPATVAPRSAPTYRPFLDGLRAVAVLGVLVYHLNRNWLPGGFLGVDIFFVLSGYLITMLLLTEQRDTGRIHLPAFWARRIRRLLPALLVVLVVMVVLIDIGGDPLAQGQARGDLLSTLFYFANWHFITSGQSYFTQFVAVSPDRHTWSLAIEEQFYLFWPIVVALVLARFRRRTLAAVAATVAVASALWMVVIFDPLDPSRAYYGTDSRIFEILIGALLAIALAGSQKARIAAWGRRLAPVALLAIVAAYLWLADDNTIYYHGGAVLIAVAAATLLAGLEAGSPIDRLLSVRPMVLVGLASYGMYLWHFPIIIFTNQWVGPTTTPTVALLAVALTFAATAISYVVVESPIRRRGLLLGYKLTPARLARVVPIASGAVALVIVVATANGVVATNWNDANSDPTGITIYTPVPTASSALATSTPVATQTQSASSSIAPTPSQSPTPEPIGGQGWVVGVVGDSVMVSAVPGLQAEATRRGWLFVSAARRACPVGYEPLYDAYGNPSPYQCGVVRTLHDQLIAAKPNVVIWHDLQSVLDRRSPNGTLLKPGSSAWKTSLFAEWTLVLNRFLAAGARVVIVLPPLRSQQAAGCHGVPMQSRCVDIQTQDTIMREATTEWFASLDGLAGVYLIQVDSLLCPAGYPCPGTVAGVQVRLPGDDQTHFTGAGSTWFAPQLLDLVVATLEGPAPSPAAGLSPSPAAGPTAGLNPNPAPDLTPSPAPTT